MPETRSGGCHCGRVRYEVTLDLDSVVECNCSICSRRGALWAFAAGDNFTLKSGAEDLADYQFNKKVIHHLFCRHCGIGSFSRGKAPKTGAETFAVNVRCLDGVDADTLTIRPFDGRSL
jgi:hypothetical protein